MTLKKGRTHGTPFLQAVHISRRDVLDDIELKYRNGHVVMSLVPKCGSHSKAVTKCQCVCVCYGVNESGPTRNGVLGFGPPSTLSYVKLKIIKKKIGPTFVRCVCLASPSCIVSFYYIYRGLNKGYTY